MPSKLQGLKSSVIISCFVVSKVILEKAVSKVTVISTSPLEAMMSRLEAVMSRLVSVSVGSVLVPALVCCIFSCVSFHRESTNTVVEYMMSSFRH